MNEFDSLIEMALKRRASDIHVTTAGEILLRIDGLLSKTDYSVFDIHKKTAWIQETLSETELADLRCRGSADFAYTALQRRCRINAFQSGGQVSLAIRLLPLKLPPLEQLGLAGLFHDLLLRHRGGLILIGGSTGAGKSTTAGAALEWISQQYAKRIITLEDPVEYIFGNARSFFCQREFGCDFHDFSVGVRDALRQDADILYIGEIRDAMTVEAALGAAESGRLVITTLHCFDTVQAIERLAMLFEPERQPYVRFQLAATLCAVIHQRLARLRDHGRIAIHEILLTTPAVAALIRDNKWHQLSSQLELGSSCGMRTFQSSLTQLRACGVQLSGEEYENDGLRL